MAAEQRTSWIRWGLVLACAVLLAPLLPAVMLAVWAAALARLVHEPLTRMFRGRTRLAAAVTVLALTVVAIPFVLVVTSLLVEAYDLVISVASSPRSKAMLEQLVASRTGERPSDAWDILMSQQDRAWSIARHVAGTATQAVISIVVFFAGTYTILVDGKRWYAWFEDRQLVVPELLARLRDAFLETGRGLFVGIGGAGLMQGIVATIAYAVLGVPHALELGVLTFCFSIIPAVGTALVWVPVSAGLALTGRVEAAVTLAILGVAIIGTIDNLVRPLLARWGHLHLPTYVVLVSMFAGVQVIGAWGLFVAPLAVRLAKAVLEYREA